MRIEGVYDEWTFPTLPIRYIFEAEKFIKRIAADLKLLKGSPEEKKWSERDLLLLMSELMKWGGQDALAKEFAEFAAEIEVALVDVVFDWKSTKWYEIAKAMMKHDKAVKTFKSLEELLGFVTIEDLLYVKMDYLYIKN